MADAGATGGGSRSSWLVLVVLALVGFSALPRSGPTASGTEAASSSATAAPSARSAPQAGQAPPSHEMPRECKEALAETLRSFNGGEDGLDALIVTVADPTDSITDYDFDRSLDAIRRAAVAMGYEPDRFWLPWTDDRERSDSAAKGTWGWGALFDVPKCRAAAPARLLFRRKSGKPLEILLVGEAATWGVHPDAMDAALSEASKRGSTVRIVGPTFSGSARSLGAAIARSAAQVSGKEVEIVTGTATAPNVEETIAAAAGDDKPHFDSLVPNERQVLDAFMEYLAKVQGLRSSFRDRALHDRRTCFVDNVALFTEVGTPYGSGGNAGDIDRCVSPGEALGDRCRYPSEWAKEHPCTDWAPVTRFEYPLQIGRLRKAHERSSSRGRPPDGRAHVLASSPGERVDEPGEIAPTFSDASPQSTELALHQSIVEMCRQDLRWVGIRGTDVDDRLFLAHEIGEVCPSPEMRLFFLDGDVLYLHPGYGVDLLGSVVVSPYPLLPQNREWTFPFSDVVSPFAADLDQGLYNAVVRLLGELDDDSAPPDVAPTRRELARERQLEQGLPFTAADTNRPRSLKPPVWVTAVGNSAFWPIAVLPIGADWGLSSGKKDSCIPPISALGNRLTASHPAFWWFDAPIARAPWFAAVWMAAAFACVGYWWGRLRTPRWRLFWGLRWAEVFTRPDHEGASLTRPIATTLCLAPLVVVCALVAENMLIELAVANLDTATVAAARFWRNVVPFIDFVYERHTASLPFILIALVTFLLALALVDAVVGEVALWTKLARRYSRTCRAMCVLGTDVLLLAVLSAVVFSRMNGIIPSGCDASAAMTAALLFRERTGNLTSGVSILPPAFAVAAALFLCGHLGLRRFQRAPPDPVEAAFPDTPGHAVLKDARARMDACVRRFAGTAGLEAVVLLGVILAWGLLFHGDRPMGTLAGKDWELWIWLASCAVMVGAVGDIVAFAVGARRLLSLLDLYAATPLASAFGRVPYRVSKQVGLLAVRAMRASQLAPLVTQLRWLADRLDDPELTFCAERAETSFRRDIQSPGPLAYAGSRVSDGTLSATYAALVTGAERLREDLSVRWRHSPPPSAEGGAPNAPGEKEDVEGSAAEEFLAGIVTCRIFHVLAGLRWMLATSTASLLLLLSAVFAYPFELQPSLVHVVSMAVVANVVVALVVLLQMERNEVLSLLLRTTPGQINWSSPLAARILLFAIVPLLAVAAVSIPSLGRGLFGWVLRDVLSSLGGGGRIGI